MSESKSCAILQSSYIPWKGYFDMINLVDEFILYDCVQFTRRDWRNRNKIKTRAGAEWLTIPVECKGNYHARIDQMKVANSQWARDHWNAIRHNYARAAYFNDYSEMLEEAYLTMKSKMLSDINRHFIELICGAMGISTKLSSSTDYELDGDKNMRLINLVKQAGASVYYSGPAAKSYIDESLFGSHGISVVWMSYERYPEYDQLFPPFDHHVTALDLLLNMGKDAPHYMNSFGRVTGDGQCSPLKDDRTLISQN